MASPQAAAPQQRQQSMVRRDAVGTYRDPKAITEALALAQEVGHLVSPMTGGISLGEGCEVAVSAVAIDVDRETYDVGGGKLGLGKGALDRISAGMGISWDPVASCRLDAGRDPRYCHFRAVGHYRAFDGSIVTISGEKEVDLREGSPQVEAIIERCVRKLGRGETEGKSRAQIQALGRERGENQIREMRLHILGHAESKARLRAVRTGLGVRTSYERAELAKPFLMARVMFTGRTDDPTLRREFARMTAAAMLGGTTALYGTGQAPRQVGGDDDGRVIDVHEPPPVGAVGLDDDYDDPPPPPAAAARAQAPQQQRTEARPPQQAEQTQSPASGAPAGNAQPHGWCDTSAVSLPKTQRRDALPVADASDDDLGWWETAVESNISDPKKARWKGENETLLDAIRSERSWRAKRQQAGLFDHEQGAGPKGQY